MSIEEEVSAALCRGGLRTRPVRARCSAAGEVLRALLPYGRAALIADESADAALTESVRASLRAYRPACVLLGEGEDLTALFALPDDVRAVVAVGGRALRAARFFRTLRGGFCLLLPVRPAAKEVLSPVAPAPWDGYPLDEPDVVLADGEILRGGEQARADVALCALCAEELEVDGCFSDASHDARGLRRAAMLAAESDPASPAGREDLLFAALRAEAEKRAFPAFGCEAAARHAPGGSGAVLAYFARRYAALFAEGRPRPFFVPDYAARVARAAARLDMPASALFSNVRVPTGEQSFDLGVRFAEVRSRLYTSARLLVRFADRICPAPPPQGTGEGARGAGEGAWESLRAHPLAEWYDLSAECSPLYAAPALEREFGLLENPAPVRPAP